MRRIRAGGGRRADVSRRLIEDADPDKGKLALFGCNFADSLKKRFLLLHACDRLVHLAERGVQAFHLEEVLLGEFPLRNIEREDEYAFGDRLDAEIEPAHLAAGIHEPVFHRDRDAVVHAALELGIHRRRFDFGPHGRVRFPEQFGI